MLKRRRDIVGLMLQVRIAFCLFHRKSTLPFFHRIYFFVLNMHEKTINYAKFYSYCCKAKRINYNSRKACSSAHSEFCDGPYLECYSEGVALWRGKFPITSGCESAVNIRLGVSVLPALPSGLQTEEIPKIVSDINREMK